MNKYILIWLTTCLFFYLFSRVCFMKEIVVPEAGQKAPTFSLPDQDGVMRSLEDKDFEGKNILLYFYPKDFTPGCTKEACNLRDYYQELEENNIVVMGISFDNPEKHKSFKEKYHLPFMLLSDSTKTVARSYGAISDWVLFSVPARKTFLLDKEHKIIAVFEKIKIEEHAQEIIARYKQYYGQEAH